MAETYTADAVALLCYLVDALPDAADQVFARSEAGAAVIQVPDTALAEVLYAVSRDKDVRGVTLTGSPEDARQALLANGPIALTPIDEVALAEFARIVGQFSIHDGLVVASHRANGTAAVITSDGVIREADVETVWE